MSPKNIWNFYGVAGLFWPKNYLTCFSKGWKSVLLNAADVLLSSSVARNLYQAGDGAENTQLHTVGFYWQHMVLVIQNHKDHVHVFIYHSISYINCFPECSVLLNTHFERQSEGTGGQEKIGQRQVSGSSRSRLWRGQEPSSLSD